jgi:hypothetical protein
MSIRFRSKPAQSKPAEGKPAQSKPAPGAAGGGLPQSQIPLLPAAAVEA